jgi:dTDP-D-glucose 4,6-dehydratase
MLRRRSGRVDRLRERLGIVAEIDLKEGLTQTAAWYRNERWITRARFAEPLGELALEILV